MKVLSFLVLFILFSSVSMPALAQEVKEENDFMHFDRMVMRFDETNAYVTVTYDLDTFARMYVLAFGTRHLESSFDSIFSEYEEAEIEEIGYDTAIIKLKDVSRLSDSYYLHDSRDLGTNIDSLQVIYPGGTTKTLTDVKVTPNIFYDKS
ncbi:hypothetical protein LI82_08490 [Methanococcoides methylutens]|uniref:Uncharacterized protein n=2 Tax=Methanococcoides methylutens TaxID=2226 RepID=A0A099T0Q3_METMT|nr:hypothetical protein LI82_08490 [Methanococcoides methylutens]